MEHEIEKVWNQKDDWFYDRAQADRVRAVIVDRLADDRIQDECRYLVRLRWHFIMGYQEVSYSEFTGARITGEDAGTQRIVYVYREQ